MSAKREKRRRRQASIVYEWAMDSWKSKEPPRWMVISHWLWRREKPNKKDYIQKEKKK